MVETDYKKCKRYKEDGTLYGRCPIFGYCMIPANLLVECEYFDEENENE